MVSDDKRREVARRLREVQSDVIPGTKTEVHPIAGRIIGVACGYDLPDFQGLLGRLADLIDPTCEARRDTIFKPAVLYPDTESDDVGREETVYRCSGCGEIVSYDEDYDPETDLPAHCERCGSRITGIGEPWDE